MQNRNTILIGLTCFALVDMIIPLPLLALLLIWVVLDKPPWFRKLVNRVYS